jgi:protein-L-isoaspartate O-methyltransferase
MLMATTDGYVLGHADAELKRLATQARLIDPITRRFLVSAGIKEGMRILDVGSGAGDVAMLLAGIVGPKGEIVGTDPAPTAVEAAEKRVKASSLANVTFRHGDPTAMIFDRLFDAVSDAMSCSSFRTRRPRSLASRHTFLRRDHVFPRARLGRRAILAAGSNV